jgi:hypothetical protein
MDEKKQVLHTDNVERVVQGVEKLETILESTAQLA